MNKKILAIGGAVIKTAKEELREVIRQGKVEMLIHNGGSIFHDFQLATENLESHSYPLDLLVEDYSCNSEASDLVWGWVEGRLPPKNTITKLCMDHDIPVLMFTGLGCDYWQLVRGHFYWGKLGVCSSRQFSILVKRFKKPFHYICMGSAVIHPEVFIKALSVNKPEKFTADVVDFIDMYRPRTRVAVYGKYYKMTHVEFLSKWMD